MIAIAKTVPGPAIFPAHISDLKGNKPTNLVSQWRECRRARYDGMLFYSRVFWESFPKLDQGISRCTIEQLQSDLDQSTGQMEGNLKIGAKLRMRPAYSEIRVKIVFSIIMIC